MNKKYKLLLIGGIFLWIFQQYWMFPTDFGSYDSLNFALSLRFYHIPSLSPHFPGYPGYVWMAKIFYFLGGTPLLALILPGLFGTLASVKCLLFFARYYGFSDSQTIFVVFFYLWNPLLSLNSLQAFSDCFALFFWIWALQQAVQQKTYSCAIFSMIGFSIRPSYAIFFLPLAWLSRKKWRTFFGTISFTSIPLLFFYGWHLPKEFVLHFLQGHFSQWGQTIWSESSPFLTLPLLLWTHFFGGFEQGRELYRCIFILFFFIFFTLLFYKRASLFFPKALLGWGGCYFIWLLAAQNLHNPRHFLPLLLPICFFGMGQIQKKYGLVLLFLIVYAGGTWQTLLHFRSPSLYTQWTHYLENHYSYLDVKIYGGRLLRIFDWEKKDLWLRTNVLSFSEIQADVLTQEHLPKRILITSEVQELPVWLKAKAVYFFRCSPYVYPLENSVALYECSVEDILASAKK